MYLRYIFIFGLLTGYQSEEKYDVTWDLSDADVVEYGVFDANNKREPIPPGLFLFAREIKGGIIPNETADLAQVLVFVPPQAKIGLRDSWKFESTYFKSMPPLSETRVQGILTFSKIAEISKRKCLQIEGAFQIFLGPSKKADATVETIQWFDAAKGHLVTGRYRYSGRTESWGTQGVSLATKKFTHEVQWVRNHKVPAGAPQAEIDTAVAAGKKYLLARQSKSGSFGELGSTALVAAALLHSEMKRSDPEIDRAFHWMRSQRLSETYDAACILIAIEAAYLPYGSLEDALKIDAEEASKKIRATISRDDLAFAKAAAQTLIGNQAKSGGWSYAGSGANGDQSNTQFAAIGLKCASRMGISIPTQVWKKLAEYLLEIQIPQAASVTLDLRDFKDVKTEEVVESAGWTYAPPDGKNPVSPVTSTMTAGCLAAIKICQSELANPGDRTRVQPAILKGLAWIQMHYSARKVPVGTSSYYTYYLYALERAGILCGIKSYQGRDWYSDGAFALLRIQRGDGSWETGMGTIIDTAFALLFLKRAVLPVATGPMK